MAIYRSIGSGHFGPDEIEVMTKAYEAALIELYLDRSDPLTELIAKAIVNATNAGLRKPMMIKNRALSSLGIGGAAA